MAALVLQPLQSFFGTFQTFAFFIWQDVRGSVAVPSSED
jgi:hypothetical protein